MLVLLTRLVLHVYSLLTRHSTFRLGRYCLANILRFYSVLVYHFAPLFPCAYTRPVMWFTHLRFASRPLKE